MQFSIQINAVLYTNKCICLAITYFNKVLHQTTLHYINIFAPTAYTSTHISMFKNILQCARRFLTNVPKLQSKSINIKRGLRHVQLFLLWCVTTFSHYTVFLFAQNVNRIYRLAWTHFIVFAWKRILHIHMRSIYSHIIYDKMCMQATIWMYIYIYIYIHNVLSSGLQMQRSCQQARMPGTWLHCISNKVSLL